MIGWLLRTVLLAMVVVALLAAGLTALGALWLEAELPPAGQFVTVHGLRLHYTDQGEGPPLVLVHGASSNLLEYQTSLVPLLARDHRVLVFDRPGFGYSERGDGPWPDPAAQARLLLDASEALGVKQPVLVGHSWAGSIVMSALLREPERVAGGVLLAGAAGHWVGEQSLTERLRDWPALNAVFARTLVYPVGSLLLPVALAEVFAPDPVPQGHAERVGAALALRPESYLHNAEDMSRLSAFLQQESTRYEEIRGPLLVIHGAEDRLVPFWNHGKRLRHVIAGIEVKLLEGQGHALHHVQTDTVARLIHEFTERVAGQRGPLAESTMARGSSPAGIR